MWSINELFYGPQPALTHIYEYDKPLEVGVKKPEQIKDKKGKNGHNEVHLKVDMCCEACVKKVRRVLIELPGVTSLDMSVPTRKVTVSGDVKPEACLKAMAQIRKRASLWTHDTPDAGGGKESKKKKKDGRQVT